jgi:hypothetical protein
MLLSSFSQSEPLISDPTFSRLSTENGTAKWISNGRQGRRKN